MKRIAILSDVALGYGCPQIALMARSLREHFSPAEVTIFEPDQKGRVCAPPPADGVAVRRLGTRFAPHHPVFHVEYNRALVRELDAMRPDVVVTVSAWVLPALLLMRERPRWSIYYMLETLDHQVQGGGAHFFDLNKMARDRVDVVVFPDESRARHDLALLGWESKPWLVVRNVPELNTVEIVPPAERNRRLLYAGTISSAACVDLLLASEFADIPVDFVGPADGAAAAELVSRIESSSRNCRYLGVLPNRKLGEMRRFYSYSFVAWRPETVNQLFAAPNKFYESIAAGVPPIVTPHPQCVDVVERYGCGIVVDSWTVDAVTEALRAADALARSDAYSEMVRGCVGAHQGELRWDMEFSGLAEKLAGSTSVSYHGRSREPSGAAVRARRLT